MSAFSPFEEKIVYERTRSLRVFLQVVCLNNFSTKLILKSVGGNFELIKILSKNQFLKIIYLYSSINIIKINTKPEEMLRIIIISEARLSKGDIRAKRLVSTGFFLAFLAFLTFFFCFIWMIVMIRTISSRNFKKKSDS